MYRGLALGPLGVYLMVVIIVATINGLIAANVATKRGMKGEGFWWGFCLGVVGIIVMRCCPKY